MKKSVWHQLFIVIAFSVLTTTMLAQGSNKSYNIVVPEGNTILSYLPISDLKTIDSLTVSGILFEEDLAIIQKCEKLRYLDLSWAYITESPEKREKDQAEQQLMKEFVQQVVSLRESVGEEMYKRGEINTSQYVGNKLAVDAAKEEISKIHMKASGSPCYLPSKTFVKMPNLRTVLLPLNATVINSYCFFDCPKLKRVVLPPVLEFIGPGAFNKCYELKSIEFPSSLTNISTSYGFYSDTERTKGAFEATGLLYVDLSKHKWENTRFQSFSSYQQKVITSPGRWTTIPPKKKILKLPQGVKTVSYDNTEGDIIYFPVSVEKIEEVLRDCIALFASPTPPKESHIFDSKIYCPKGSITKYYTCFGESNEYIEVEDIYDVDLTSLIPAINNQDEEDLEDCYDYKSEKLSIKPHFQGQDINGFYQWVNSHINDVLDQYVTDEEWESGLSGTVKFSFIVNIDGYTSDIIASGHRLESVNKAVASLISSSDHSESWTPGSVHGKDVRVKCTGQISFR